MCDTANASILTQIIDEKVAARQAFTAFDISSEGKGRGTTERHGQMRRVIHDYVRELISNPSNPLDYTSTFIPTPGGSARLWHPVGYDVQVEIDRINGTKDDPAATPAPMSGFSTSSSATIPTTTSTVSGFSDTHTVDAEGRLAIYNVPAKIGGCKVGTPLYVYESGSSLVIAKVKHYTLPMVAIYKVNADGRIRISADNLSRITATTLTFTVEVNNNELIIRPA